MTTVPLRSTDEIAELMDRVTVPGADGRPVVTWLLRGCPGLQAGEESDSCGAGPEKTNRPQGDSSSATTVPRSTSRRCTISELRDRRADLACATSHS